MLTAAIIIIIILLFAVFSIHSDVEKAVARVDKLEILLEDAHNKIEEADRDLAELLGNCDCKNENEEYHYEFQYKLKEIQCHLRDNKKNVIWDDQWKEEWEKVPDIIGGHLYLKKNYDD